MYRSDETYTGTFMGRECLNKNYERIGLLKFPVEAFKDFLKAEGLSMPDFWQDKTERPGNPVKPDANAAACLVSDEHQDVEPPEEKGGNEAPDIEVAGVGLSEAIAFGVATRDVLEVLADYLKRPPERQRSKNKNFPTEAQCVLDALDLKAQRNHWGRADDGSGRLSKAQWMSVRTLFLPETKKNQGCKGGRWGGKTDRD